MKRKIKVQYGYYEKHILMEYDAPLKYKPYAQAGVIFKGDDVILVSYESDILTYDTRTKWLHFHQTPIDYSRSTIGHVSAYLKEYLPTTSYYDLKQMRKDGTTSINLETGEAIFE